MQPSNWVAVFLADEKNNIRQVICFKTAKKLTIST